MHNLNNHLYKPSIDSHKGENGRLLVIGGSTLFHASIFWSADVASRIVDLVHFTSPANENNVLVRQKLKAGFWNGIVVDYASVQDYLKEDDCVLIGPGMPREDGLLPGEPSTAQIVNDLLTEFPQKRWVIDGGALQVVDINLLNENMIVTPHHKEWDILITNSKINDQRSKLLSQNIKDQAELVKMFSISYGNVTVLLKGREDIVCQGDRVEVVNGGNAGMTKGGTGDVLAGLVSGLYCKNDAFSAAVVASNVMKRAGDELYATKGVYFNAGDLVAMVPQVLAKISRG